MLTLREVEDLLGITYSSMRRRIQNKELPGAILIKNSWHITDDDFKILKKELKFIKNSYTLKEAKKILGLSQNTILNRVNPKDVKMYGQIYYVKKNAIEKFPIQKDPNYITLLELSRLTGVSKSYIQDDINCGYITDTKKVGLYQYVNVSISETLKKELFYKNNSYTSKDLISLLSISRAKFNYIVDVIKEEIEWMNIRTIDYFIKNDIDNKIKKLGSSQNLYNYFKEKKIEKSNTIPLSVKKTKRKNRQNFKETNYLPQDFEYIIEDDYLIKDNKKYLLLNKVPDIFNFKISSIKNSISKKLISDYVSLNKFVTYVSLSELEKINMTLKNSLSIPYLKSELQSLFGSNTYKNIDNFYKLVDKNNIFLFNTIGQKHLRVNYFDKTKEEAIKEIIDKAVEEHTYKNIKNPYDRYEFLEKKISEFEKTKFSLTIKLYKEFTFYKIDKSTRKDIKNVLSSKFSTLKRIINNIPSEINELNDEQIKFLLNMDVFNSNDTLNLSEFLKYIKLRYNNICNFNGHYNRYIETKEKTKNNIYTINEWTSYSKFLTNIDLHIEKAFNNYRYAKIWLYSLLHFSIDWRSQDILSIPPLEMLDVDIYSLDWFKNNEFTLTNGQFIINAIKKDLDNTKTLKTGVRKHFVIYMNYIIPTSIAFIILEKHRRFNNKNSLFYLSKIEPRHIASVLGCEMDNFSNIKANRTLLTYCHSTANKTEGYTEIAYSLSSYLRSHKPNLFQIAESTSHYIYATNKDGNILDISNHLFKRGVFGWLYKALINLAYGETTHSISDTTKLIEDLKQNMPILSVEALSKYLETETKNQRHLINELIHTPKSELKNIINKLLSGDLVSKENHIYCLKYKQCPYSTKNNCCGCKYSIPTNYSLLSINTEILSLINKLNLVDISDYTKRQKYTYQLTRLLFVLKEAKAHFDKFDKEYIKTFLNLDEIQIELNKIKNTKFLLLK